MGIVLSHKIYPWDWHINPHIYHRKSTIHVPASSKGCCLNPKGWCFSAPFIIRSAPLGRSHGSYGSPIGNPCLALAFDFPPERMASRRTPRVVRHLGWTLTPRRSKVFSRWWFQRCFVFIPTWGNLSNLTNIF